MVSLAEPGWTEKPWMVTVAASGVEVLVLDAARIAAVHGIGKVGPKAGDVEQGSALADLLIRGKGDAQLAVGAGPRR